MSIEEQQVNGYLKYWAPIERLAMGASGSGSMVSRLGAMLRAFVEEKRLQGKKSDQQRSNNSGNKKNVESKECGRHQQRMRLQQQSLTQRWSDPAATFFPVYTSLQSCIEGALDDAGVASWGSPGADVAVQGLLEELLEFGSNLWMKQKRNYCHMNGAVATGSKECGPPAVSVVVATQQRKEAAQALGAPIPEINAAT